YWANLSRTRDADFGRDDIALAAMLADYATGRLRRSRESVVGLIEAARLAEGRGEASAHRYASTALDWAIALDDAKLAEQAAGAIDQAVRDSPAFNDLYRNAIAKLSRKKLNRAAQVALEGLLDVMVRGSLEEFEESSEIAGK